MLAQAAFFTHQNKNARLRGHLYFGGVDGAVKKIHPSNFSTNKIKDLATLLIKGNRKTATKPVTTAKRARILPAFFFAILKGME